MFTRARRPLFLVLTGLILLLVVVSVSAAPNSTTNVQILAINDFHGNLEPPAGSSGRIGTINAGGAEFLATHIQNLRATNPNTVVVSAGDLIGASPLISALFHDEPTIEAMNLIGLNINAVGNHEFDEGVTELLRMQYGGCHPIDGCQDGDPFGGARFSFLAANVVWEDTGKPILPAIRTIAISDRGTHAISSARLTKKIAFIGMTLEGTPTIVTPSGVAGVRFLDEADTVNAWVPKLKALGVEAIVVLIHEGGVQAGTYNECVGISGPIVDIVNRLDPEVDLVISGHTHQAYNCVINDKLVTSAASFGRLVTDIDLTLDMQTGDITSMQANNVIVTRDVAPSSLITTLIEKYRTLSAPLANRVIGAISADILRAANAAGESALGDVIADSQLYATAPAGFGEAVIAFMNPGGIRADLTYAQSGSEGDGNVTYNEAFTVQPFGNSLVTMSLTGDQIRRVLEQQFDNPSVGQNRILQVSTGFTYTWSVSAPTGSKIDPASILLNGVPLDMNAVYRVTVNNFLADGGDNFSVLAEGTDRLGGAQDLDALEAFLTDFSPVPPGPMNRIIQIP